MTSGEQRWQELANKIVGESGFDLEDFTVVSAGRRRVVKVVVDSDDGVSLDVIAQLSRQLSEEFDAAEEAESAHSAGVLPYTLEVTSPGIGRPLIEPRHFHRARTRTISAVTRAGHSVTGRVVGITEDGVDLLVGKSGIDELSVPFAEIAKAKVEVDFSGPSAAQIARLSADPRNTSRLADQQDADQIESATDQGVEDEER